VKFPQHIILDVNKSLAALSAQLWFPKYFLSYQLNDLLMISLNFHKKFFSSAGFDKISELIKNKKKLTIKYSKYQVTSDINEFADNYVKTAFEVREKVKHRDALSKHWVQEFFSYFTSPKLRYDERGVKRLLKHLKKSVKTENYRTNKLWSVFNIYFLKKEKIYTKLKYSRVPQYDIVSGGAAALFAAFLGFLICEKYGFELADSGDFYYLFMYVVILCFSLRIFLKLMNAEEQSWHLLSLKWAVYFLNSFLLNLVYTLNLKQILKI